MSIACKTGVRTVASLQRTTLGAALAAIVVGAVAAVPASAQVIEEIIVTAQKREQNLNDVPVAVTVLNNEAINNAYANSIEDLQALVPSLSFRKGNTTRNSALTVRGIGTISFSIAAEPSVSTVVDGVVLGRSGQAFADLYDIERIEVLRGPQGTLFGKNASAGVVNIITRSPSEEFAAEVDLSFYQDDERRFKGRVTGPLGDKARASVTFLSADFDGFIDNVFTNKKVNGYDRTGVRGMLDVDARDDLTLRFIAERYEAEDDCCTDIITVAAGNAASAALDPLATPRGLDTRVVDQDFETVTLDETTAFSVQVDKDFGDFTLTSITATREWDNTEFREGDFLSNGGRVDGTFQLHDIGPQEWRQFSQEIRLTAPAGERFEYQVGAFYWDIDSTRFFTRFATPFCDATMGCTEDEQWVEDNVQSATMRARTSFDNWAVFGQGTINLTDSLRVLLGARFTDDEVSFEHNRTNPTGIGAVGVRDQDTDFEGSVSDTDFSWKLGLQYDLGGNMVYATGATGYKGPAFNVFFNQNENQTDPIAAETSDSFEIGYKLQLDTAVINLAAFYATFDDFQANNFDVLNGVIITRLTNAGSIETSGIEADFIWQPTENLSFSGGVAFIEAEIDEFNCPIDPNTGLPPAQCTTRSGLDVPYAPDLKYSLAGQYVIDLADGDGIYINGSYVYTDEQVAGLPNNDGTVNPASILPDYGILNASIGYSFDDDNYRISLIGKNLTDEQYYTTYSGGGLPGERYQIARNADRYFGVSFRARFD